MMRKVLLPTDFSESSRHAIRYAVRLFGSADVEYILFHAFALPTSTPGLLISLSDILRLESEEALQQEAEELIDLSPALEGRVRWRSENAFPEGCINKIIEEEGAELVVMGTSGAGGVGKVLWGSTATAVLRKINFPVMIVPRKAMIRNPQKLIFAMDKEVLPDFAIPPFLEEIIESFKAKLSLLNVSVNSDREAALGSSAEAFDFQKMLKHGVVEMRSLKAESAVEGISRYISENPSDMLVMIARRYGFVKNILHRSTTRQMAMISHIPILILREEVTT